MENKKWKVLFISVKIVSKLQMNSCSKIFLCNSECPIMQYLIWDSYFFPGFIGNVPIMLAKPQTFMNSSGESVSELSQRAYILFLRD